MPEEEKRSSSIYGTTAEPCSVILFGASGDLAKRKVIPAMYDLAQHNSLGERYATGGFARPPSGNDWGGRENHLRGWADRASQVGCLFFQPVLFGGRVQGPEFLCATSQARGGNGC